MPYLCSQKQRECFPPFRFLVGRYSPVTMQTRIIGVSPKIERRSFSLPHSSPYDVSLTLGHILANIMNCHASGPLLMLFPLPGIHSLPHTLTHSYLLCFVHFSKSYSFFKGQDSSLNPLYTLVAHLLVQSMSYFFFGISIQLHEQHYGY